MKARVALSLAALVLTAASANAQALPRISGLYPPGARAGSTVEVSIRGGGLDGASEVLVDDPAIKATLNVAEVKIDAADQKVFASKCALCHELRGPSTISRTADQWVATVDRMITQRGAPIEAADKARIVRYMQAAARAAAGLTARVSIAPDALPGRREIRIHGANGTSTVFPFEVTRLPETLETEPNDQPKSAPEVKFPLVINGQVGSGDVDCFAFQAKKGERVVFNCDAYRLNESSQAFFFPVLYLYDASGKELVRDTGTFGFDPVIDWTAPADGRYVVLLRDMLYRGSPASIYRLSMGNLAYGTYLFPAGGRRGSSAEVTLQGENQAPEKVSLPLPADAPLGVRTVSTPRGSFAFVVGDAPEFVEPADPGARRVSLPVSLNGRIERPDEVDRYTFTLTKEQLGPYAFEVFADRIGSPLAPQLALRNAKGQSLFADDGGGRRRQRDGRQEYTFTQAGDYTLEVADPTNRYGPSHIYRVSLARAEPDFRVSINPDNPNLGPGSSVFLTVRMGRRGEGAASDLEVLLRNLPPGVTASPCVIRAGENQSFIILTAAADAKPGSFSKVQVVARAKVDGKTVERPVTPYEIYRIQNQAQNVNRSDMIVSVGPAPMWTVTLEPATVKLSPKSGPVTVTARLNRNGLQGDLPFAVVGLPNGVQGPRALLFRRGSSEATFTLAPQPGTGVFASRPSAAGPAPPIAFALVNGREGEAMQMSSPLLNLQIEP